MAPRSARNSTAATSRAPPASGRAGAPHPPSSPSIHRLPTQAAPPATSMKRKNPPALHRKNRGLWRQRRMAMGGQASPSGHQGGCRRGKDQEPSRGRREGGL